MNIDPYQLLEIGIALSSEKDGDTLFERILTAAMDITNCDAGTLYMKNQDSLAFHLMITKSQGIWRGGRYGAITLPPVPLIRQDVCAFAALDHMLINIPNCYSSGRFDFSGPKKYDALTGYKTVSMLVVPMADHNEHIIAVLQLVNAMDQEGQAIPFSQEAETLVRSLSSQAAICLTNMNYSVAVRELMHSFVQVMSTAIDARTPYNANHTRNMVRYGGRFIDWLNEKGDKWTFTDSHRQAFLLAAWLHDVGKLTIPLEIMDKNSRLGHHLPIILDRFRTISLLDKISLLEKRIEQEEYDIHRTQMDQIRTLILCINSGRPLSEQQIAQIQELSVLIWWDEEGNKLPLLTETERSCLLVRKGTLTQKERTIMEGHVVMTTRMLNAMKFPAEYADVPEWAGSHHEFLNGAGYPMGIAGDELTKETRLLTILDVFEAITAQDRPYTSPMPTETALSILDEMAVEGKLDKTILSLFRESRAWEGETV